MRYVRRKLLPAAWIALCAMLAAAFAPLVTQSLAFAESAPWGEICSANGLRAMPSGDAPVPGGGGHAGHCPYCSTHAGSFGLPPPAQFGVLVPARRAAAPVGQVIAPRPRHAWLAADPRGPPVFS
ncbi:MAG: DUF2946 domain-containing protein [Rhodocyclaceae bacterium]|nr:DUF2946 domain-containing protein [Rhodocyclaceae bacterium]